MNQNHRQGTINSIQDSSPPSFPASSRVNAGTHEASSSFQRHHPLLYPGRDRRLFVLEIVLENNRNRHTFIRHQHPYFDILNSYATYVEQQAVPQGQQLIAQHAETSSVTIRDKTRSCKI